jgi:hypothetical protein
MQPVSKSNERSLDAKMLRFGGLDRSIWHARRDSNPRPSDPKSDALIH